MVQSKKSKNTLPQTELHKGSIRRTFLYLPVFPLSLLYLIKKKMKYHPKPHKKTEDKKSYITKIREEEQKKMDRLKKTNDKKNEDDSEKVDDNSQ